MILGFILGVLFTIGFISVVPLAQAAMLRLQGKAIIKAGKKILEEDAKILQDIEELTRKVATANE